MPVVVVLDELLKDRFVAVLLPSTSPLPLAPPIDGDVEGATLAEGDLGLVNASACVCNELEHKNRR